MPSLLEFMGYVFFFGSFIVGPAFEYADYIRFCNMEMFTVSVKASICAWLLMNITRV
jgi:hypothetical protein